MREAVHGDRSTALSTKHSNFREKVDPAGFGPPHFPSDSRTEHRWEPQGRRYSRPQGLGHLTSFARTSRRLTGDHSLRPAKADLVEVPIGQMRTDVVEHA
jgi:hypothetical protein